MVVLVGRESNKGGRGQRNREEIVAGAASPLVRAFLRLRHSVALDKTTMLRKLNLKYIAIKNMERGTRWKYWYVDVLNGRTLRP